MKRIFFGLFAATLGLSGCMAPSQTLSANSQNIQSIVIQYSGGKEIGRWYLDQPPGYGGKGNGTWVYFQSGDSTFTLSGDIRIINLPSSPSHF